MANVTRKVDVDVPSDDVWSALADFHAIDKRLLPGHVVSSVDDGDVRILTIHDGAVLREKLIDIDHAAQRLAYTIKTDRLEHHNAVLQVEPLSHGGSRISWSIDILPHHIAPMIAPGIDAQLELMATTIHDQYVRPADR